MNIALFLQPKAEVTYLRENMTLRQGLEIMHRSGYTAVPVVDGQDKYVGTVSEGDFLWSILLEGLEDGRVTRKDLEHIKLTEIIKSGKVSPVCIDTDMEALVERAKNQNFVPVVDDRGVFIGIITRSDIIKYFCKKSKKTLDNLIKIGSFALRGISRRPRR